VSYNPQNAQAHARLMFRPHVTLQDAVAAVMCIECSKHTSSLVGIPSALQSDFPQDPDAEYHELEHVKAYQNFI
jgi:hypothetical protein